MKKLAITALCVLTALKISAQTHSKRFYRKNPVWIEMIKDSNVNYFEAVKAYDLFWEKREKPMEEDEAISQDKSSKGNTTEKNSDKRIKEKKREKELYRKYGLEVKKFEHWKKRVLPYVQPDGRILSKEEQLKMWEESKK